MTASPYREMPPTNVINEVMCLAIPRDQLDDPLTRKRLDGLARQYSWTQYDNPPTDIEFINIDWLITDDEAKIEQWQPAHECEECRLGNQRALTHLRANPEHVVALANIEYIEHWWTEI